MEKIFEEIRVLQNSPMGLGGDLAKMNEEWGELGRLISMRMGMQDNPFTPRQFKKEFTGEAVDLIQNICVWCQNEGITWADLQSTFIKKNSKWRKGIKSGKYGRRYKGCQ